MNTENNTSVKETLENHSSAKGGKKIWVSLILILLLGSGSAAFFLFSKESNASAPSFQSSIVELGSLRITVTATGNLEATNQVDVGSELSGIITSVLVDYNDTVELGQPLAYLDNTKYEAAVQKATAQVASAKADYQQAVASKNAAKKTYDRYQKTRKLTGGKTPSIELLEQAQADYEKNIATLAAAKASISSAEATLKADEIDLSKTVIYSPTNGIILDRNIDEGQTVAASLSAPVLFTVAEDLKKMELQVDIDEADVGKISEGQRASFSVDAYPEQTFSAIITQVRYGSETSDGVVTYKAVLEVSNPELLLRPGMTATASIIVSELTDNLLVPNSALRFTPTSLIQSGKPKTGLISSLMPGPKGMGMKGSGKGAGRKKELPEGKTRIWTIDAEGLPKPLLVNKVATDGMMTAVTSEKLQEGMQVITNELITTK